METKPELLRCKYNDCGWCYAPYDVDDNSDGGMCKKPKECQERNRQVVEFIQNSYERKEKRDGK